MTSTGETSGQQTLISDDQNRFSESRRRNIILTIFVLLLLFTSIIAAIVLSFIKLKQKAESTHLAKGVTTVCYATEDPRSCFASIKSLPSPKKSKIFTRLLHISITELETRAALTRYTANSESEHPVIRKFLLNCEEKFEVSVRGLNRSLMILGVDPEEQMLGQTAVNWYLQNWVKNGLDAVQKCVNGLGHIDTNDPKTGLVKNLATFNFRDLLGNQVYVLRAMQTVIDTFFQSSESIVGSSLLELDTCYLLILFLQCLVLIFLLVVHFKL